MKSDNKRERAILRMGRLLHPVCELDTPRQVQLFENATTKKFSPGEKIPAENEAGHFSYLIDGAIHIYNDRGMIEEMDSSHHRAKRPIFKIFPHGMYAIAKAPVIILRLEQKSFERLMGDISIDTLPGVGESFRLYDAIYRDFKAGKLQLPVLRDTVLKIRKSINDPNSNVKDIAQMLLNEPVISARVVQMANSVLYAQMAHVKTVVEAINRIGLRATNDIVIAQSLKTMFNAKDPEINQRLKNTYKQSTLIASLSFVLARHQRHLNNDQALLAGLMFDIGVVPILHYLDHYTHTDIITEEEVEYSVSHLRGIIGGMVLEQMGFEKELVKVAEESYSWDRDFEGAADYCDLVIVAQLHSKLGSPEMLKYPLIDQVPAFHRLNLGEFDPGEGLKLLRDGKAISDAIMGALG